MKRRVCINFTYEFKDFQKRQTSVVVTFKTCIVLLLFVQNLWLMTVFVLEVKHEHSGCVHNDDNHNVNPYRNEVTDSFVIFSRLF